MLKYFLGIFIVMGLTGNTFAQMPHRAERKKMAELTLKKLSSQIPQSKLPPPTKVLPRDVTIIKPPSSSKFFYSDNELKAEYNKLIDLEIQKLYKLSQKYKTSKSRGEIWLRLAERYVEKGKIIDFAAQDNYDKKIKLWEEKKIKQKPSLPKNPGRKYYLRAIQAYEWFVRDFPKDPKVPQALYFLGYSNFEISNEKRGESYYKELTQRYASSVYVDESHFALGEYYFEKDRWQDALEQYGRLIAKKSKRLFAFSLYKIAWCQYRMGKYDHAVNNLEKVIRLGDTNQEAAEGIKEINTLRLREEAIKDYVAFYAQTGKYEQAQSDFYKATNSEKITVDLLEALAYRYSYSGNVQASTYLFKKLIAHNPEAEKAAKYQYQIVQDLQNINNVKAFKSELTVWIEKYGPDSQWAHDNANKKEVVSEMAALQETTVRNHTLRLHQTAVSVKTDYTRQLAADSYKMYLHFFHNSPKHTEMRFFYAELLFDMKEYEKAAAQYQWVAQNDKASPYYEKAVINNVLSLEKLMPSDQKMEANRAKQQDKLAKIPYEPEVKKFEQACLLYLTAFPKGEKADEIKKRLGSIYFVHNDFDPALKIYRGIIKDAPKSKDAPIAAEYILDIHNSRHDLDAYSKEAAELLKNPTIARSDVGKDIRNNLNKVSFLRADTLSKNGKYEEAAKAFESFASVHKTSDQALSAIFNAGANYEKAHDVPKAMKMYEHVLAFPGKKDEALKQDVRNSLAELYKKMGNLEKSAVYYEQYGRGEKGAKAKNAINNASILYYALGREADTLRTFKELDKMSTEREKSERNYLRAEFYYQKKNLGKAIYYYDQFLKLGGKDPAQIIKAMYNIGEVYAKKGQQSQTKQWFSRVIAYYKEKRGKVGAKYAAQAMFWQAEKYLDEMKAVRLGTAEKTIVSGFQRLKTVQKTLLTHLADVIKVDYGPSIVAALAAEAESYEVISKAFKTSPVPREYSNPEQAKQFRQLADQEADGFLQKAKGAYKAAFDKGIALEAYGEPILESARAYHRLAPDDTKNGGEITTVGNLLDRVNL
ncbi:MAG: tetratricopeptide repeat protein [Bdellovibrionaceae bacterium]|nr:tetratricopeptide repeat protein [Pseudobdellovibrionaceae bacterium]